MGRDEANSPAGTSGRSSHFDEQLEAAKQRVAGMINGIDEVAATNLDGLDAIAKINAAIRWLSSVALLAAAGANAIGFIA